MPGRRVVGLIAWPLVSLVVAALLGWALGVGVDAWVQADSVREPGPETLLFVADFPIIIGLGALIQSLGWLVGAVVGGLTWTIGLIWGAHRLLPERRRGVPVALAVVLAVAGSAIGIVALGAPDGGLPPLGAIRALVLGAFVVGGLVFPVWAVLAPVSRLDVADADDVAPGGAADLAADLAADVAADVAADLAADAPPDGTRRLGEWMSGG